MDAPSKREPAQAPGDGQDDGDGADALRRAAGSVVAGASIAPYLREIGRGKDGARSLSREQAADVMARLLDGEVDDVQTGAFAIAMRIKGETPEELAGFMDAVAPRMMPLPAPAPGGAVVLPSYNGARKLPNLVPLLALLLARSGLSVLVHGLEEDPGRVTTAAVFEALGLAPVRDAAGVAARWASAQPAFVATGDLHPALARLLALRRVIGLRNPAHSLAKLLPALPAANAVRVVNHTHPAYAESLGEFLALTKANALLMRGTEGEPVADARRCPRLTAFVAGVEQPALSIEAQGGSLTVLPELPPTTDAEATARYIEAVLAGAKPLPPPIATQVEALRALVAAASEAGSGLA
jgi:anthranilate phosphoribosyltransferase